MTYFIIRFSIFHYIYPMYEYFINLIDRFLASNSGRLTCVILPQLQELAVVIIVFLVYAGVCLWLPPLSLINSASLKIIKRTNESQCVKRTNDSLCVKRTSVSVCVKRTNESLCKANERVCLKRTNVSV